MRGRAWPGLSDPKVHALSLSTSPGVQIGKLRQMSLGPLILICLPGTLEPTLHSVPLNPQEQAGAWGGYDHIPRGEQPGYLPHSPTSHVLPVVISNVPWLEAANVIM